MKKASIALYLALAVLGKALINLDLVLPAYLALGAMIIIALLNGWIQDFVKEILL